MIDFVMLVILFASGNPGCSVGREYICSYGGGSLFVCCRWVIVDLFTYLGKAFCFVIIHLKFEYD